jgi:LmbE family N-acetylglucosaminyl deacetylase
VNLSSSIASFDPANHGTPEAQWAQLFELSPSLSLPSSAILVVSPHPDDEVLGAGGLMHCAALAGREVRVLSVTDGEAAYSDWADLAKIRRREARDALQVIAGKSVLHHPLSIPDGRVDSHRAMLLDAIDRQLSPNTLLVAPYERDGHPDHNATGEVCCEIARLREVTLWRYPIWTWHHANPEQFTMTRCGRFDLDAVARDAKVRAMSCFTSQLRPLGRAPIVPPHVLRYFTRPYEVFLL